jgi:hypothetical protein
MAWITPTQAATWWKDAAKLDTDLVESLLAAAEESIRDYGPQPAPDPLPESWKIATAYQARDIWTAASRDGDAVLLGDAAFPTRVRPLSAAVQQLLRPHRPRARFGGSTPRPDTILDGGTP